MLLRFDERVQRTPGCMLSVFTSSKRCVRLILVLSGLRLFVVRLPSPSATRVASFLPWGFNHRNGYDYVRGNTCNVVARKDQFAQMSRRVGLNPSLFFSSTRARNGDAPGGSFPCPCWARKRGQHGPLDDEGRSCLTMWPSAPEDSRSFHRLTLSLERVGWSLPRVVVSLAEI